MRIKGIIGKISGVTGTSLLLTINHVDILSTQFVVLPGQILGLAPVIPTGIQRFEGVKMKMASSSRSPLSLFSSLSTNTVSAS